MPEHDEGTHLDANDDRKLLTHADVAEMFGVTTRTVSNWVRRGLVKPVRIAGTVRFRSRDIDDLIEPNTSHE